MVLTHSWSHLSSQRLGQYAEYLVKMELTLHGLDVYSAEVDDKGIDFIVRKDRDHYFDIQVKSVRNSNYIFFPKSKFVPCNNLYAAVVLFSDGLSPVLYLIPSLVWHSPNELFVERNYVGKKSQPEYGINLSQKNIMLLQEFAFEKVVEQLKPVTLELG